MKKLVVTLGLAALGAFAVFIWPGQWNYIGHIRSGDMESPVRVHRITGATELLVPGGWTEIGQPGDHALPVDHAPRPRRELSPDKMEKIKALFGSKGVDVNDAAVRERLYRLFVDEEPDLAVREQNRKLIENLCNSPPEEATPSR